VKYIDILFLTECTRLNDISFIAEMIPVPRKQKENHFFNV